MIYKNGLKEYLIMCAFCTVFFGLFMGIYSGFVVDDFNFGIISGMGSGLFFGVFFTIAMAIVSVIIEKKSENLRAEISKVRSIICEGPANHKKGANGIGGWLFLSEDALEFYPHKANFGGKNIAILIDDITNVDTKANQLIIQSNMEKYQFVVNKSNMWKKSIIEIL